MSKTGDWTPLLQDLIELDEAGALDGIRAVIAERLRQVRDGHAPHEYLLEIAAGRITDSQQAAVAALLAARIDRRENQSRTVS